eukprot:COSAG02_NODE_7984_length_2757_cov_6.599699_2_plen_137_part_00
MWNRCGAGPPWENSLGRYDSRSLRNARRGIIGRRREHAGCDEVQFGAPSENEFDVSNHTALFLLHEVDGRTQVNPAMTDGQHREAVKAHLEDIRDTGEKVLFIIDDCVNDMKKEAGLEKLLAKVLMNRRHICGSVS